MASRRARIEFTLADDERDKYARGDEPFVFDPAALVDTPAEELERIEQHLSSGYSLALMLYELYESQRAMAVRFAFWLARRAAGIVEDPADFRPHPLRTRMRRLEDEPGDPPASSSATASEPDESPSGSSPSDPT